MARTVGELGIGGAAGPGVFGGGSSWRGLAPVLPGGGCRDSRNGLGESAATGHHRSTKAGLPDRVSLSRAGRPTHHRTGTETKAGRMELGIKGCVCPEMIVKPDGTIRACGCDDSPVLGNVNDVVSIPDDWEYGECYKNQRRDEQ